MSLPFRALHILMHSGTQPTRRQLRATNVAAHWLPCRSTVVNTGHVLQDACGAVTCLPCPDFTRPKIASSASPSSKPCLTSAATAVGSTKDAERLVLMAPVTGDCTALHAKHSRLASGRSARPPSIAISNGGCCSCSASDGCRDCVNCDGSRAYALRTYARRFSAPCRVSSSDIGWSGTPDLLSTPAVTGR